MKKVIVGLAGTAGLLALSYATYKLAEACKNGKCDTYDFDRDFEDEFVTKPSYKKSDRLIRHEIKNVAKNRFETISDEIKAGFEDIKNIIKSNKA